MLFAAKLMMPKRTPSYAVLVWDQTIEEKANKISFMLIFRNKLPELLNLVGKKRRSHRRMYSTYNILGYVHRIFKVVATDFSLTEL